MAKSFAKQVAASHEKTVRRMTGILRESTQRLVHEASTPTAQGGHMPVDTGFLRNSIRGSFSTLPGAGSQPPEISILQFKPGDTLYIGWTAKYAIYMEARYGFMRSSAQNWNHIVDQVTGEVKRRIK